MLKKGDKVIITRRATESEGRSCSCQWMPIMDRYIGKTLIVQDISPYGNPCFKETSLYIPGVVVEKASIIEELDIF